MKALGNGTPIQCIQNLIAINRGEVPMDRTKGISARFYDMPKDNVASGIIEDALWVLNTYEPRIDIENIALEVVEDDNGNYQLVVKVKNDAE